MPVTGQPDAFNIASIGAGVRWQWRHHLEVAVDAAYVLDGIPGRTPSGDKRGHFNLIYRF